MSNNLLGALIECEACKFRKKCGGLYKKMEKHGLKFRYLLQREREKRFMFCPRCDSCIEYEVFENEQTE